MQLNGTVQRATIAAFGLVFSGALLSASAGEYRLSTHTDVMYHDISGPGKASSFYDPGTHFLHESELFYLTDLGGGWESELDLGIRLTDTRQFDTQDASLQRLSLQVSDELNAFNFGDYHASFSSYSMNKTIKGAAYQRNFGERSYVRAAFGTFDGQWSFLLNSNDPLEPMDRYGGGLRVQHVFDEFRLGANIVHVQDEANDPRRPAGARAFQQWLTAGDWEWRSGPFMVNGEHAYANTDVDNAGVTTTDVGTAHKVAARARLGKVRMDARAERVSPDFRTLGGGATPDRLRLYTKADARLDRRWHVFGTLSYHHNNLEDQLATRTRNDTEELGVRRSRLFDRRYMKGAVSVRRSAVEADDGSRDTETYRLKFDLRDRLAKVVDVRGTWEKTLAQNNVAGRSGADSDLYSLSLGSRHRLESGWQLRPNAEFGLQEVDNLTSGELDVTRIVRLGMTGNQRGGDDFGVFFDRVDNDISIAGSDAITSRFNAYWQHKLKQIKNAAIRVEYTRAPYNFENSTRDYDEQLFKISFIWNSEGRVGE